MSATVWTPELGWHDGPAVTVALDHRGRIATATVCEWDTGSMYGCQPACSQPATRTVTTEGYRGPYVNRYCDRHARLVAPRIYPDRVLSDVPREA